MAEMSAQSYNNPSNLKTSQKEEQVVVAVLSFSRKCSFYGGRVHSMKWHHFERQDFIYEREFLKLAHLEYHHG